MASEWQPIETAAADQHVYIWNGEVRGEAILKWRTHWSWLNCLPVSPKPTHWMPLPPPPGSTPPQALHDAGWREVAERAKAVVISARSQKSMNGWLVPDYEIENLAKALDAAIAIVRETPIEGVGK